MKPAIKRKLIAALKSKRWLLNLKDPDAPLCEILPDGRHRFSPAGVLCDLAPKEVEDWVVKGGCVYLHSIHLSHVTSREVDEWAGDEYYENPPINGHRTLAATIKAIEEL